MPAVLPDKFRRTAEAEGKQVEAIFRKKPATSGAGSGKEWITRWGDRGRWCAERADRQSCRSSLVAAATADATAHDGHCADQHRRGGSFGAIADQKIRNSPPFRRRAARLPAHTFSDIFDVACLPMRQSLSRGACFALLERTPRQPH
jgi:hypothetical protein